MKILVTGANGQLGTEIRNLGPGHGDDYIFTDVNNIPGVATEFLDITDREAVGAFVRERGVGAIVNCAAYTNVEKAEDDQFSAQMLNCVAAANLAGAASDSGATLIHISTDYVFGGTSSVPYREDDLKSPLGVYGRTKLAGEQAVTESGCKSIIIRTAWLYSPYGKNFVKTMRTLTAEKDSISVVYDQVGSPTCAADLASLIVGIISEGMLDRTGIYHFTDEGAVSWYDFAQAICRLSGNTCDIRPVRSSEFPTKAKRPQYSVLDKAKVKETFGVSIPYWLDSLQDTINRL